MKKVITVSVIILTFFSCQKKMDKQFTSAETPRYTCGTAEALEIELKRDPKLAIRMEQIEAFTRHAILNNYKLVNGKIVIPVVFNVLYKTTAENITKTQLQSQIDILNADFNATNSDYALVPSIFAGVKASVGISFTLNTTYDIHRKATTKTTWLNDDAMKNKALGGINPSSPTTKLNIWIVGNLTSQSTGNSLLGYATFPGTLSTVDGVVIGAKYVGNSGPANYPYNLGRTATHEIGHWMNLRHIWGDTYCGDDYVSDTPVHDGPNYGYPVFPKYSLCDGQPIEMTMNFMDNTDDRAKFMFTYGQKARIDPLFMVGGARASFR